MDKILEHSKKIIKEKKSDCMLAVDATCGHGNDTLFLSTIAKSVYAFDVQDEAIISTKKLLQDNNVSNCNVIKDSHINFNMYVKDGIDVVMFNLGYLPKGDKSFTTKAPVTLKTLQLFMNQLNLNGIISIVIYPGHLEGAKEARTIQKYLSTCDQHTYDIIKYEFINQINNPPFLIMIERIM